MLIKTRTTHAYDALRCSKRHAVQMVRMAQVSDVARLVRVQRTVQKNDNVKSEAKYLACEKPPIRAFYFWLDSCSSVALLASTVGWLPYFLFSVASCRLCSASFMHFAPQIRTLWRASRTALPVLHRPQKVVRRHCVMYVLLTSRGLECVIVTKLHRRRVPSETHV